MVGVAPHHCQYRQRDCGYHSMTNHSAVQIAGTIAQFRPPFLSSVSWGGV
jgi:hypothetical protein